VEGPSDVWHPKTKKNRRKKKGIPEWFPHESKERSEAAVERCIGDRRTRGRGKKTEKIKMRGGKGKRLGARNRAPSRKRTNVSIRETWV